MKILKMSFSTTILCLLLSMGAYASSPGKSEKQDADYPFYRWSVSVSGGISRLMAEDSRKLPFWNEVKPTANIAINGWITPVWGIRLQAGGGSLHGYAIWNEGVGDDPGSGGGNWFLGENYPNPIGRDRFNTYLESAPDADPALRAFIKNNYFDLDKPRTGKDGSKGYIYSFSHYRIMADLMVNLNTAIWGREGLDDLLTVMPFGGLGWAHTQKDGILPKVNSIALRGGINAEVRIAKRLGLNIEGNMMLVPEVFDRFVGSNQTQDAVFTLTAGLTWKFGKTKPKEKKLIEVPIVLPPVFAPEPAAPEECPDMILNGLVYDTRNNPIENAVVFILNAQDQSVKVLRTDRAGAYQTTAPCGTQMVVKAVKNNYLDDCFKYTVPAYNRTNGTVRLDLPILRLAQLQKDQVIQLENILYDFDKWNIRPDAAVELDKVVAFLQQNPYVSVILGSHTDIRGSYAYNDKLSQRRAESAVAYITARGISPTRIMAKGYGERKLLIEKPAGVPYTEEEHQANRRTEIIILDLGTEPMQADDPWARFVTGGTYRSNDLPAGFFDKCGLR